MLVYIQKSQGILETHLHLAVDSIASTRTATTGRSVTIVTPVTSTLTVGTIASHMASIATDATDNVGSEVALLGAIVLAMSNLATCRIEDQYDVQINRNIEARLTVLAGLVLVVTEGTVQRGQLSELVTLELILTFGNGGSLEDGCQISFLMQVKSVVLNLPSQ